MTYKRFEDLPVWKAGIQLAERVFALVDDRNFNYKGDLRSQLQRAAVSVSNNIAEGFERGILLEGFNDVKEGDVLEVYETRQVERTDLSEAPTAPAATLAA